MSQARFALVFFSCLLLSGWPVGEAFARADSTLVPQPILSLADFLPSKYVTDGSVSYQAQIQKAIDVAAHTGRVLVFPPMVYRLDEAGLQLRSGSTLWMQGATFRLGPDCNKDGQAFHGHDVTDVQLIGGAIVGSNKDWPEGVNLRGVYITGKSATIRIRDMHLRDLSSNGVGIFGTAEHLIRDVWVTDLVIENCCNRYGDYLTPRGGPEKGSKREDQGLIAFYHVQDFVVRGCRLEKSRSDGTHFYRCRQGQFVSCKVYGAQMGGYFVESSEDILAADSIMRDNGSRGVTIERGSHNCTLRGCVVANSGREGLWAPDCTGLVITGNVFDRNGRKPNGTRPTQVWNANITIDDSPGDPTHSPTRDYLVSNNILYTTASQVAAIRIDANATASGIVVRTNLLRGDNRRILVAGERGKEVLVEGNE
jgi:hypothetical protein